MCIGPEMILELVDVFHFFSVRSQCVIQSSFFLATAYSFRVVALTPIDHY